MPNQSDFSQALDAASAPAWKPAPGDKLIGEVIDVDEYDGQFGGAVPVLTIEVTDPASTLEGSQLQTGEQFRVFGFGTVLSREMAKQEPQVGDVVGVKFIGIADRSKPGQQAAKLYKFRVFARGAYGRAVEQRKIAGFAGAAADAYEFFQGHGEAAQQARTAEQSATQDGSASSAAASTVTSDGDGAF